MGICYGISRHNAVVASMLQQLQQAVASISNHFFYPLFTLLCHVSVSKLTHNKMDKIYAILPVSESEKSTFKNKVHLNDKKSYII